eukprot:Pgem_evm1s17890
MSANSSARTSGIIEGGRIENIDDINHPEYITSGSGSDSEGQIVLLPEYAGPLMKWTNYISGWQTRWVILSDGLLSYYR